MVWAFRFNSLDRLDDGFSEVISNGLPLWSGVQFAVIVHQREEPLCQSLCPYVVVLLWPRVNGRARAFQPIERKMGGELRRRWRTFVPR